MSDVMTAVLQHLQYLGYEVVEGSGPWVYLKHERRYNFSLRPFPSGIRMHFGTVVGRGSLGSQRLLFLEAINGAPVRRCR